MNGMSMIAVVILGRPLMASNGEDLLTLSLRFFSMLSIRVVCRISRFPKSSTPENDPLIFSRVRTCCPLLQHMHTHSYIFLLLLFDSIDRDLDWWQQMTVNAVTGMWGTAKECLPCRQKETRGEEKERGWGGERGVSLLGSSPNNKLLALLCIYAEPTSAALPGAARTLKGYIVSE